MFDDNDYHMECRENTECKQRYDFQTNALLAQLHNDYDYIQTLPKSERRDFQLEMIWRVVEGNQSGEGIKLYNKTRRAELNKK